MQREELFQDLETFKKQFEKNITTYKFEELDKEFFIESYFLTRKMPYLEKNFNIVLLQILNETLKIVIGEAEYYLNINQSSTINQIEADSINDEESIQILTKIQLETHKIFKEIALLYYENQENTKKAQEFIKKTLEIVKTYQEFIKPKVQNQIKLINEKIKENEKEDKEVEIESSMFI